MLDGTAVQQKLQRIPEESVTQATSLHTVAYGAIMSKILGNSQSFLRNALKSHDKALPLEG